MISGGSGALCELIGRRRYQLLMGFIPLTSAISGNVGLQASTLTTRAISHTHVSSKSYMPWFLTEVGAAACLGIGMGLILGSIAFAASNWDIAFGLTIFIAQFISIVTAGITGTFAPLLFSFIFKRDSGKWGGPLETAIQDIVGSFAMVVISYKILELLGAGENSLDPDDYCGGSPIEDSSDSSLDVS
jgi:Mg/Co/Ni transporter MgtE